MSYLAVGLDSSRLWREAHKSACPEIVGAGPHSRTRTNQSRILVLVPCKKCEWRNCLPHRQNVHFPSKIQKTKHLSSVQCAQSIGGQFAPRNQECAKSLASARAQFNVISCQNPGATGSVQFDENSGQILLEGDQVAWFIAYGIGAAIFGGAATRSGKQPGANE